MGLLSAYINDADLSGELRKGKPPSEDRAQELLIRALASESLVAFVGAGLSRCLGYPGWAEAPELVAQRCLENARQRDDTGSVRRLQDLVDQVRGLSSVSEPSGADPILAFDAIWSEHEDIAQARETGEDPRRRPREAIQEVLRSRAAEWRQKSSKHCKSCTSPKNPYDSLVNLPIRRFLTTNWDLELEEALRRGRGIEANEPAELPMGLKVRRSFTQARECLFEHGLFSTAQLSTDLDLIFHCHGRVGDPDTLIAGTDDYQRWYLRGPSGVKTHLHLVMESVLRSNPILFLGYGLGDEDLLTPLRILGATAGDLAHGRLFQLERSRTKDSAEDEGYQKRRVRNWTRYGVITIPLHVADASHEQADVTKNERERWAEAYDARLSELLSDVHRGRSEWKQLPPVRRPGNGGENLSLYREEWSEEPASELMPLFDRELERWLRGGEGTTLILLEGPEGSWNKWMTHQAMRRVEDFPSGSIPWGVVDFEHVLDTVSVMDHVLHWLGDGKPLAPRDERLADVLQREKRLLVFNGFGRLLHRHPFGNRLQAEPSEASRPAVGNVFPLDVRMLTNVLLAATRRGQKSLVLVTGHDLGGVRDVIVELQDEAETREATESGVGFVRPLLVRAEEQSCPASTWTDFFDEEGPWLGQLLSLVDGNRGLILAARHLLRQALDDTLARDALEQSGIVIHSLEDLCRLLAEPRHEPTGWLLHHGLEILAAQALREGNESIAESRARLHRLVKRLAQFGRPLSGEILDVCLTADLSKAEAKAWRIAGDAEPSRRARVVEVLRQSRLLRGLMPGSSELHVLERGYRDYVLQCHLRNVRRRRSPAGVSGLLSGLSLASPSSCVEGTLLFGLAQSLQEQAGLLIENPGRRCDKLRVAADGSPVELLRSCFSLIRDRMPALSVAGWLEDEGDDAGSSDAVRTRLKRDLSGSAHGRYVQLLLRTLQLTQEIAGVRQWLVAPFEDLPCAYSVDGDDMESSEMPLTLGDLSWLHNELGLTFYIHGRFREAHWVWLTAREVARAIDRDHPRRTHLAQAEFQLALSHINLGQLALAERRLADVAAMSTCDQDSVFRCNGLVGRIHHLQGRFDDADACYSQAIRAMKSTSPRATCFFKVYEGHLACSRGDHGRALACFHEAASIAKEQRLVHQVVESYRGLARVHRYRDDWDLAAHYLALARSPAEEHLFLASLVEIDVEECWLALHASDVDRAKKAAFDSLHGANRHCPGLQQTRALRAIGKVMGEHRGVSRAYLEQALSLATAQRYWILAQRLERELVDLR
ncbi:MAG: SIR2 family protein [Acidobacteriota bacterium]